eukprot:4413486-Prymnesium_polylepis.1
MRNHSAATEPLAGPLAIDSTAMKPTGKKRMPRATWECVAPHAEPRRGRMESASRFRRGFRTVCGGATRRAAFAQSCSGVAAQHAFAHLQSDDDEDGGLAGGERQRDVER